MPCSQLVTAGQTEEAVQVLQHIADHNGSAFNFAISDVDDGKAEPNSRLSKDYSRLENGEEEDTDNLKLSQDVSEAGWRRTLQDYTDRISCLLEPRYRTMTLLVWSIWFTVSAAYTYARRTFYQEFAKSRLSSIFNVFLPTFLEEKLGGQASSGSRLESLVEYCIYTIAGYGTSVSGYRRR